MGIPPIADERFWEHYAPLCTAIAREFQGEDMLEVDLCRAARMLLER